MQYAKTSDTYVVRLETGEEIVQAVTRLAEAERIDTGSVSGIGSVSRAVLGYYDLSARQYVRNTVEEDCEIVSLAGNIAIKEGRAFPHLHVTLGTRSFQALAGHLFEGRVGATCEILVRALPGMVQRHQDQASGLWLLDP
jgi:predicted DNA-binding protein with PD1-like motif